MWNQISWIVNRFKLKFNWIIKTTRRYGGQASKRDCVIEPYQSNSKMKKKKLIQKHVPRSECKHKAKWIKKDTQNKAWWSTPRRPLIVALRSRRQKKKPNKIWFFYFWVLHKKKKNSWECVKSLMVEPKLVGYMSNKRQINKVNKTFREFLILLPFSLLQWVNDKVVVKSLAWRFILVSSNRKENARLQWIEFLT